MVDEHETLVERLMNNWMLFVASTIHPVGKIVQRTRKRPRETQNNQRQVDEIWGENGTAKVHISMFIDNYTYWIGGVNINDQSIS
eukprot:9645860-Ditylum_brightwellii.AAC.1